MKLIYKSHPPFYLYGIPALCIYVIYAFLKEHFFLVAIVLSILVYFYIAYVISICYFYDNKIIFYYPGRIINRKIVILYEEIILVKLYQTPRSPNTLGIEYKSSDGKIKKKDIIEPFLDDKIRLYEFFKEKNIKIVDKEYKSK